MLDDQYIRDLVSNTLAEDIGTGDLTAALIKISPISAAVICREPAVVCGCAFFDEVFRQLDTSIEVFWQARDCDQVDAQQTLCTLSGPAPAILSGERSALNLLQTLSGTATLTRQYVDTIAGTGTRILDTRKTLPGLRLAQKYAVHCGGGYNHRLGLYDGILIKENHLRSGLTIPELIRTALTIVPPGGLVEVEVTDLSELQQAIDAGAPRVLLDNFSLADIATAVKIAKGQVELEASGGIDLENIRAVAETGVDFISVGALTKHVHAVDMTLLADL